MPLKGYKQTAEHKRKTGLAGKGKIPWNKGKPLSKKHRKNIGLANSKENNGRWIKDRSKIKRLHERNNPEYGQWRRSIWIRDNFKCKMNNENCSGRIEVHHILGWTAYPELRYDINNGITLCHAHHPRKRAEEKRLIPIFKVLV